jgi:alpha-galactosidase
MTAAQNTPYSAVFFRTGERPGVRYVSGPVVYDEAFQAGRLVTRYWNPDGQVWPEMHYENLKWGPDDPADVFELVINGQNLAGGLEWVSAGLEPDTSRWRARSTANGAPAPVTHSVIHLRHAAAGIEVNVHTRLDGSAFLIRWLEITNCNAQPVGITAVAPFSGVLWNHMYEEKLPPAKTSPFELAYNHHYEWGWEGDFYFEPLPEGRRAVDGGRKGRSGWGRPAFWARNLLNGQTFVCELAWSGNHEFALEHRRGDPSAHPSPFRQAYFRMGLSGYDPVLRVLDPGETLETPAVHMALFQTDTDSIVQATHDHVRHVVMPEQIPGHHVEIEANHRGYLCDRENVPDIIKDIDVAAAIGADMYVIDAGWYGNEPNQWWNNTGDWFEGAWIKKDGGLRAIVDHAHNSGMTFGLWIEVEAAGANSTLKREHPDWLLKRDGQPIGSPRSIGRALDLTNPEVAAFVEGTIDRAIRDYDLDMYRLDHNHEIRPAGNRQYGGFTEDLTWRYYENFCGIFDRLRARHPKVVFQNCAGGGGRLDWGTLSCFHNTELSDWMRMPRGFRILNGTTMSLPPEILLRTFGTEVPNHVHEGNADTQLRLCFSRIIFRGIAPTIEELTPYLRERITHYLGVYKHTIRPIMEQDGRAYHHTPFQVQADPNPWCALEYARPDRSASVAVVFHTSSSSDTPSDTYVFRPRGLHPGKRYTVTLDNGELTYQATGIELATQGVPVSLNNVFASELLLFEEA